MAVQVHYQGSVFDLDTTRSDALWLAELEGYYDRAALNGPVFARLDLDDGRSVTLRIHSTTPIAVISSVVDNDLFGPRPVRRES